MKKVLKIIGMIILALSMGYASNWDMPKETRASWVEEHREEIEEYERSREFTPYVIIDGEIYEGQYIDGMWYEPLEIYGGAIPDEFLMGEEDDL